MKRKKFLKEQIGKRTKQIQDLMSATENEERALTEEERGNWEQWTEERDNFEAELVQIEAEEKRGSSDQSAEERAAAAAAGGGTDNGEEREMRKLADRYDLPGAIFQVRKNGQLSEGAEAEVQAIADDEARDAQIKERGDENKGLVSIPGRFIQWGNQHQRNEQRDLTIGTEGADVNFDQYGGFIPFLRPDPVLAGLGTMFLTGVTGGDIRLPRQNAAATMAWEGETDAGAETTPTFNNLTLAPNRVGGYMDISQQFIRQSSVAGQQFAVTELQTALALAIDAAGINGSGSGSEPTGILNTSGIGDVAGGANGLALSYANLVNNWGQVAIDDALTGNLHWLTNNKVVADMLQTPKQGSGVEGNFILNKLSEGPLGYNVGVSSQVPSNLTKGSGTDLSALIFGNFAALVVAQWGGVDLIIDPYTQATNGLLRIPINAYVDCGVRNAESFSAVQDIITNL